MSKSQVTSEHIERYNADGAVVVKNALDMEWVEYLRRALDDLMDNPTKMGLEYAHNENSTRFFGDQYMWLTRSDFKRIAFESPLAKIAGEVMEANSVTLFFDQVLVKEPGAIEPTPSHHDLPYWMVRGEQICTVWIALDPVSYDNGGMKYVRGSHHSEKLYSPTFFGDTTNDNTFEETRFEPMPDIENMYSGDDFISFELEPGDAAIHHARTFHGAPGNRSAATRRRGYMLRVLGDNIVYAPGPGQAKVAVRPDLPDGAPMGGEYFPEIWRRSG